MEKFISLFLSLIFILSMVACGNEPANNNNNNNEGDSSKRVVLIGNQKFGDKGPMDDMAAGGDRAAADYGLDFKKMESTPARFEDDIRTMAREGYGLIITTFP